MAVSMRHRVPAMLLTAQSRLVGRYTVRLDAGKLGRPGPCAWGSGRMRRSDGRAGLIPLQAIMFRRNKTRIRAPSRVYLWTRFQTSPVCLSHRARARTRPSCAQCIHPWPKVRPRNGRNGLRVLRDADGKNYTHLLRPPDGCKNLQSDRPQSPIPNPKIPQQTNEPRGNTNQPRHHTQSVS
jgi:hypothetical protein